GGALPNRGQDDHGEPETEYPRRDHRRSHEAGHTRPGFPRALAQGPARGPARDPRPAVAGSHQDPIHREGPGSRRPDRAAGLHPGDRGALGRRSGRGRGRDGRPWRRLDDCVAAGRRGRAFAASSMPGRRPACAPPSGRNPQISGPSPGDAGPAATIWYWEHVSTTSMRSRVAGVADTLAIIGAHLPRELVDEPALRRAAAACSGLPAVLTKWIYFECRLRGSPRVDLVLEVDRVGRSVLAGDNPAVALPARYARTYPWNRVCELCAEWGRPEGQLARAVHHIWLELDVPVARRRRRSGPAAPGV